MLTTGCKLYFGFGLVFLLAAIFYGWTSGGVEWGLFPGQLGTLYYDIQGALTLGWRGAVGDHLGYTVLLAGSIASFTLGGFMVAFRDNEASAVAEVAGTATAPAYRAPTTSSLFVPVGAFGLAVMVLGLVTERVLLWAGMVIVGLVALEWVVHAWADRATGDARVNQALRNRVMNPIEVPVAGVLIVGFVVFGISRVLLTVDKAASVWLTIGFASAIFVMAVVLAAAPRLAKPVLGTVLVLGALAVLAGGVIGAARGEREFEEHHGGEEVGVVPPSGESVESSEETGEESGESGGSGAEGGDGE
jgi:hypothetical protein